METPQPYHAERSHHPFGMSKLAAFSACPVFASKDETSAAAEEGTELHERMDRAVATFKSDQARWASVSAVVQESSHEVAEDHLWCLMSCARLVDRYLPLLPRIENEFRVRLYDLDGATEVNYGSGDLLMCSKDGRRAVLIDYKFGFLPVPPAGENLQGWGYAAGTFQRLSALQEILVIFAQPRLGVESRAVFRRSQLPDMVAKIRGIVERARWARDPKTAATEVDAVRAVNKYCRYCDNAGRCPAVLSQVERGVVRMAPTPLPVSFDPAKISDPAQVALMRYWTDVVEGPVKQIKEHALAIARENGGRIECTLPDGTVVAYKIAEERFDRVLGPAAEVADALREIVTPAEVLVAAKLSIGALEKVVVPALQEQATQQGQKVSKKRCAEQMEGLLEAAGLLSRPNGTVEYLRAETPKQKQVKE